MKEISRKLLMLMVAGMLTLGVAGCNTMEGLGEDTEDAGDSIERETDEMDDEKGCRSMPWLF